MIKKKIAGQKPVIAAAPERGNVVNLMDALKASLSQGKPPAKSQGKGRGAKEPATKAPAKPGGTGGRARRGAAKSAS
jgi:DNA end-binding protein Ku